MQIEIDIDLLIENDISADDYLALYAVYRKGYKTLDKLSINPDWEKLQKKCFVKLGSKTSEHTIRQEFIDLFSSDFEQMFTELLNAYPLKVSIKNGGYRILKAADPNARANNKSRERYKKVIGDNLEYMQQLEVWINNHTWEKYINIDEHDTGSENRIIRKL